MGKSQSLGQLAFSFFDGKPSFFCQVAIKFAIRCRSKVANANTIMERGHLDFLSLLRCWLLEVKLGLLQTGDSVGGPQIMSVATQKASRSVVRVG